MLSIGQIHPKFNDDDMLLFAHQLRGQLIQPGDAAYDEARKVWNGMNRPLPRPNRPQCQRLAALKAKYDPTNLFKLKQNVSPADAY